VAEVEAVPCAYGGWYAAGSPYPPGRADAVPTAAMKARVRSMFVAFDGVIGVENVGIVVITRENRAKKDDREILGPSESDLDI
jgi:hypothetical protein